ncbi:zinc finger protein 34-like isoform X2 [Gadus chalcogrammus]|uniref:zinc finger protein 34-like isoform X2 n=1 Tax=Gadus chalcogrammus TaxID=1042646 RepID=UPI0024C2D63D|nr:zinc finger protein 34-like isoform X2 [Gadus chalcogrammus]
MVNCCVCFGCNNSNLSGHRVHRFPNKKDNHFRAWIRFVQAKRSNFAASSVTRHTVMCEKHFTPDSYNQGDLMESRLGFRRREWVRLANGAVPSVHAGLPATSGGSESSTSRESARRKRELCTILGESAASNDAAGATTTSEPEDDGDGDTSTMDPEPVVVHRGSQCNIRCFHRSLEDCDDFGDCSTQRDATSESLYAPGSSHMSSHNEELRILNVYGKGEGPLALDGHDTLVSELEALNSLSADHSVVKSLERGEQLVRREELTGQQTPDTISIKVEEDMDGAMPALEDCDDFGDCSTQHSAALDSLHVDAPGSSHMSGHKGELRILNVYGKGEGPLALDGNDTLFTASKLETLNSLSADHREELTVQQTPDTISIKEEEDIDWGMHAGEDCDDFGDCSTQHSAALDSLHVDAPGSSHMSGHKGELRILNVYGKGEGPLVLDGNDTLFTASKLETLNSLSADHREELTVQQTPDTISIKEEEDIDWGMHAGEDCDDFGDCSTQRGAALDSLHVDTPGSSHMSSHKGELRILNVYGKGEGPLAVDGHDTLFTACKLEAQDSLSADHSVVKSLESGEQLVHREELTRHRGGGKGRPCVLSVEGFPEKTNMSTRSGEKPYGCDQCKKRFQLKGNLKIHMRTHSREKPYRCDQCVKRFSLSFNLKVHMRTHSGEKPYKCNQCVMCFGHSASLKSHMRTHSGEKPYRCNQCVKRFSKSYNLKIHMRIHSGEKPYRCDQCMKCFSKSYNLKIHMRTHSGEKPNKCNQCMKCFSHSSDLKVHIRTHSGEKPYRCDQCVKRFSHSTDLKIHMRTHSREKPYRCDQCVKRFSHSTDLKSHMRTHSGLKSYGCDQCVKRFGQSSHLKSHMRIHSGEKPYRCDQCVMCFSQSSGLKRHMRIHSGEKPYRCDQCVKRFNQCSALKRHKRTCSGEKP